MKNAKMYSWASSTVYGYSGTFNIRASNLKIYFISPFNGRVGGVLVQTISSQ